MFSLQLFMPETFVACILSSSHIALNGLQKNEWIESFLFLLNVKRSGGEVFLNINPNDFFKKVPQTFTFIIFFLSSTKYVIFFRAILFRRQGCYLVSLNCSSGYRCGRLMLRGLCRGG